MRFDLFTSVKAQSGKVCDAHLLDQALADPRVAELCRQIADAPDKERQQQLKKQLPIATFNASFGGKPRKNANAIPSGLCSVDIDDLEFPYKVFWDQVWPSKDDLDIRLAYMTPSQHGLRVVFVADPARPTIADNMAWFEHLTGLQCDPACKDLARASYLVPEAYVYYRDNKMFTDECGIRNDECGILGHPPVGAALVAARTDNAPKPSIVVARPDECPRSSKQIQSTFKGLKLSTIAHEWLNQNGGQPAEGERNTVLHRLAISLRYITEFQPEPIFHAIPHCGLGDAEVMALCRSACNAPRTKDMPADLRIVITRLTMPREKQLPAAVATDTTITATIPNTTDYYKRLPRLPIGLRETMAGLPDKSKMAVLCGLMPLLMTYATRVRVRYCDGKMMRLNAMCIIVGDQASGKSAVKDAINLWKRPMKAADAEARSKEDEFKRLRKNRKANEKLPEEPRLVIIEVPITISCSTLLKRLKNARGLHLFSFGEELDTLRKTNGAGSWSSKYDVYRLSYDNGEWGQDYNSDQAESGVVEVAYNWTVMGTPGAVQKCFRNDNVENGMGGRIIFCMMPSMLFEYMPSYVEVSPETIEAIEKAVDILVGSAGDLEMPRLRKAMKRWCNQKADEARNSHDKVIDTFRKRASVTGFRCGVVFHLLECMGDPERLAKESNHTITFAQVIADMVLDNQCYLFGQRLLDDSVVPEGYQHTKNKDLIETMPALFTFDDLQAQRPDQGYQTLRTIIHRWLRDGRIRSVGGNCWEKIISP